MKKLLLIIISVLLLCSCDVWEESVLQEENSFLPEISSENEEPEEKEELTRVQEVADKYIFEYEFRYNEWMDELAERGISVSFENREFTGDKTWEADLVFKNSEKELRIPFSGIYDYSGRICYGKVLFPDNKTAVFCGNRKAVFFDTETLEQWDFEPEFPDFGKENIWVNGAGINEKTGEIVLFATPLDTFKTNEAETILIVYKGNKFTEQDVTKLRGTAKDGNRYNPLFFKKADFFENKGKVFFNSGYEFLEIENGKVWELGSDQISSENGSYRFEMVQLNEKGGEYLHRNYLALLYQNGKVIKSMIFSEPDFCDPNYAGTDDKPTLIVKGDTVIYRFPYFAMTLTLDFKNDTHKLEYSPTEMNIEDGSERIFSPDKKYLIYTFGRNGAGDVSYSHVAIRNNETRKHTYFGEVGGMYGGYNGMGFLKNNDIYCYDLYNLEIFDPETLEIKFDINKNFPFGYDEETESGRGLLTFRRDPEDFSYIIVYYEHENRIKWSGEDIAENSSYKIGFFDSEGNLLKSYDTGHGIIADAFGICDVEMRYSEEKITLIVIGEKGGIYFEGAFDLKTKEFKELK